MKFRSTAAALLSLSFLLVPSSGAQAQTQTQDKVLHMFLSTSETGLDPAVASDNATLSLLENLFDPLLRYDYLARPARLRPNTATAMPTVSSDGLTYT
ncbi:MAG: heme-binding protein, partial [Oxalobacteraceae bacterium]